MSVIERHAAVKLPASLNLCAGHGTNLAAQVQPRVFTVKCNKPGSVPVMVWMKEGSDSPYAWRGCHC